MNDAVKRLDDFVREKMEETYPTPLHRPPFGFETDGEVIASKHLQFHALEFLHKYRGVTSFGADFNVIITVLPTRTGIVPLDGDNLPYRWTGAINETVAEMAVRWAFELLTDGETLEFLEKHHPAVVFCYMENRRLTELKVCYENSRWTVE